MNNLAAAVGVGILGVILFILMKPLKDPVILERYPFLQHRILRLLLVLLFVSQLAEVVDPVRSNIYYRAFDLILLLIGVYFSIAYVKRDQPANNAA